MESPIHTNEINFVAVCPPIGECAAGLRDLPSSRAAGKVGDINLFSTGIGRTIGQPASVRRKAKLNNSSLRRLGLNDRKRFLFARNGQRPYPSTGRTVLLHVDQEAAIRRPLRRKQSSRRPLEIDWHLEQEFLLPAAVGEPRAQGSSSHQSGSSLLHIYHALAIG